MKWYYSIRSNVMDHGVADDAGLADLIRQESLKASDLVCSEATGNKWVPVSAVDGLLAAVKPPPLGPADRARLSGRVARPWLAWRRAFWILLALAAGLLLGSFLLRGGLMP